MEKLKMTPGHQTLMPYFIVNGADKFIDFLKSVFNAEEKSRYPAPDGSVMHAEVMIGESTVMMGNASEQYPPLTCSMYTYVSDTDKTYQLAIKNGCTSLMEPRDETYGARGAGFKDPFGNVWWIATLK